MPVVTSDLVAAICCIVASVGGMLCNGTLIAIITMNKDLRQKDYIKFILNRTLIDFAFSLFLGTLNAAAILTTGESNPDACVAAAFFGIMLASASLNSEPFLALNRYVSILKNQYYKRIYTKTNIILMCAFSWVLALVTTGVDLYGDALGRSAGFYCSLKFSMDHLLLIFCTGYPSMFAGLACIIFCNYRMYIYLQKHQTQPMTNNQRSQLQNDREMLRFIFAAAFIPVILECPVGIISLINMVHPLSGWFTFAGTSVYFVLCTINPIITLLMVRSIRKEFTKLIGKVCHGNSVIPVERIG